MLYAVLCMVYKEREDKENVKKRIQWMNVASNFSQKQKSEQADKGVNQFILEEIRTIQFRCVSFNIPRIRMLFVVVGSKFMV